MLRTLDLEKFGRSYFLANLAALAIFFSGCKLESNQNLKQGANLKSLSLSKTMNVDCHTGSWTNGFVASSKTSSLIQLSEKGIENKFDCNKPIVIFVHGWAIGNIRTPFPYSGLWRDKGYTTLSFQWDSFGSSPVNVFYDPDSFSILAEKDLADALRSLRLQMGDGFQSDIHLVGHSFGAKVAIGATARAGCHSFQLSDGQSAQDLSSAGTTKDPSKITVTENPFTQAPIRSCSPISRVTMLDPALLVDYANPGSIGCNISVKTKSSGSFDLPSVDSLTRGDSQSKGSLVKEAMRTRAALLMVKSKGIKIENYAANVANFTSIGLTKIVPTVIVTKKSLLPCHTSMRNQNLFEVHSILIEQYFRSIVDKRPPITKNGGAPVISPVMNTSDISAKGEVFLVENQEDLEKKTFGQMEFRKVELRDLSIEVDLKACGQNASVANDKECDSQSIRIKMDL